MDMKNKLFKETAWSFMTKSVTFPLFLGINIILARRLGVTSFGLWSLFLSVMTVLFTLSYFGANHSARRFAAQYNRTPGLKNVLTSSIKLRVGFSSLFCILLFLFRRQIAVLMGETQLEKLFLYGIPLLFLSGIVEFLKSLFMGLHRIKYNFFVNLSEYGLKFILAAIFLAYSTTVSSVIGAFTLALLITAAVGIHVLYSVFYKHSERSEEDLTKEILLYSLPFVVISLGFIALTEIDTVMLGIMHETMEVGIYGVAKQIVLKLPHIALALAMGTMPIFAKLKKENREYLERKFRNLIRLNTVIFAAMVVGILLLAPYVVPFAFGQEYARAALPLQILSFYLFCSATSILLSTFLDYTGRTKVRAVNIIVTIVLNILLNLILIPPFGAVGAATATSVSFLPYVVLNWMEARKVFSELARKDTR